jgi:hypothetical protein
LRRRETWTSTVLGVASVEAPDLPEKFLPGDGAPHAAREKLQKPEFRRAQVDRRVPDEGHFVVEVDPKVAVLDRPRSFLSGRPAEQRSHARHEFRKRKGFLI